MEATYGRAQKLGTTLVIKREIPNFGEAHIHYWKLTSHTCKRSACQRIGQAGTPWPLVMAMQKAENKPTARMYQLKEACEYDPVRQLLNAPPGLVPAGRAVSSLDVLQALKVMDMRIVGDLFQQVELSNLCAQVFVYTLVMVYTLVIGVYTERCWCIH